MGGEEASVAAREVVLNNGANLGGGFSGRAVRLLDAVLAAGTCGVFLDRGVNGGSSSSKPPVKSPAASLLAAAAFNQYCCCSVLLANRSSCEISSRRVRSRSPAVRLFLNLTDVQSPVESGPWKPAPASLFCDAW